jgi:hypothetical protein
MKHRLLVLEAAVLSLSIPAFCGTPTFNQDVKSVIEKHCVRCHQAGEIAPMSLVTFREVRPWAAAIREAVISRTMPPWPAEAPLGHFSNDWRLTPEELELVRRWADAHAPEGQPVTKDENSPQKTPAYRMGQPDLVLHLPQEQHVPGNAEDHWKYIFLDRTFDQDTWIRGLEIRPGNRKVVHHANILLVIPEGDKPVDWSNVPEDMEAAGNVAGKLPGFHTETVHVGLPGRFGFETESGTAVLLPKGSRLRINIHYAPVKTAETDNTEVGLYLAKGTVEKQWQDLRCKLLDFMIPANTAGYQVNGTRKVTHPITIYQVGAHMHLRGQAYRIEADLPDGKKIELLNVPRFSFDWQLMYVLAEPVHLPAGTVVHYTATYNNSSTNQLLMRYDTPDRAVGNGERTIDEMMTGYVMYTADSEHLKLTLDRSGHPVQLAAGK